MAFNPPPPAPHDLPLGGPKNTLKPTPGKTPAPSRTVLPPPPKAPAPKRVSLTPQQEANLQVKRLLAPQYQQADTEAARQNAAINAFTKAAMQQLQGAPGQIGQIYSNALGGQTQLVQNAADSLRAVNPTGDVSRLLDAIGAPKAQGDQIAGNLNNTFNGGAAVGQYVGGLPIQTLRGQGATAQALAALEPGNLALSGRQALISALAQQSDARSKIGAQVPQLEQSWLDSFHSNQAKRQQIALEQNALGIKTQQTNARLGLESQRIQQQQNQFISRQKAQIDEFNARQTSADRKLALPNASLSSKLGYLVDSSGAPVTRGNKLVVLPGNRIVNGRVVKVGKGKGAPRLSAYQVQKFTGEAETIAANAKNGFVGKDPTTGKPKKFPPLTLPQAWEEMRKHGVPETIAIRALRRMFKVQGNGVAVGADVNPVTNPNASGPTYP